MKRLRKAIGVFVCVVAVSLMLVGPTQAGASCRVINATAQGQDLGNGATVANIMDGGLLQGTTKGNFTFTNFSFPVATFAGPIQFTTNRGTLTIAATGTVDVTTGVFSSSGPVSAATGKLAGATGFLSFSGVENLTTGSFVEAISGQLCADLAP